MPSRSTATLGTTTTRTTTTTPTTTNAVRKTPRTSAYFTRSTTRKKKEKKEKDLHRDDSQKNDGDGKSCSDEQAHILTVPDTPVEGLEDSLAQSRGDDYDGVEGVQGSADAELGNKALTERFTRADECFQQILFVEVEDPIVPQKTLDTHEPGGAANELKQDIITLSKDITDIKTKRSKSASPRKNPPPPKLSPYFPKPLPLVDASCLPFPPISASSFGLIQEQLTHSPFRLLIATIFLNRTRGPVAIPVLFQLFEKYPTIQTMADANHADIVTVIRGLGFQNQRANKFIAMARTWLSSPPQRGKRYRKLHYPCKRDGVDIGADEVIGEGDARVAWEIAHLPGVGAYAIDSWRIFCRDILVLDETDPTTKEIGYEPEWKRVLPQDKELRAYLTWMWLKEGWLWDPETGNKTPADAGMMERAKRGGVAYEAPNGNWVLESIASSDDEREKHVVPVRRAGFSLAYS
jgi:endonuclease III